MRITNTFVFLAIVGAAALAAGVVSAQGPTSVLAGVYTEDQAKRGATIYAENCAACHGDNLLGNEPIPGLAGAEFQGKYKTMGELFEKTSTSMPATAPGSLTGAQVADVLAHVLAVNKYPAGSTELPSKAEPLAQIAIEPAK